MFKVHSLGPVARKKTWSDDVMEKGDLLSVFCEHWPQLGCTSIAELKCWGQGPAPRSPIPDKSVGQKGLHAVLKIFKRWIWVRKEGGNWRLKRIMKNVSALYCIFYVSLAPSRKPADKLPFDGRRMRPPLQLLKATQATQVGTSSEKGGIGTGSE